MNDEDSVSIARESLIEDLTVNEEESHEVKGGPEGVNPAHYSAVVFVGGWGSSSY